MPKPQLLTAQHVPSVEAALGSEGTVFRTFADQDSGCVSYGIEIDGSGRFFVKTAATADTVASLRRALAVHQVAAHPRLIPIVHGFTTDDGLALVYPWADGEVLYHPTRSRHGGRAHPDSAMARFRRLPLEKVHEALAVILDVHIVVADADLVAVDFYDGCMLYDFSSGTMRQCDSWPQGTGLGRAATLRTGRFGRCSARVRRVPSGVHPPREHALPRAPM